MHELSICLAILDQVEEILADHPASHVSEIHVAVGALSGVEPELVVTAWPLASAGTALANTRLHLAWTPARIFCAACDVTSQVPPNRLRCPLCRQVGSLVEGEGLILSRVVLVTED